MKKLTFGFMAFALAIATVFTSCSKDDDDKLTDIAKVSATIGTESFSATAVAKTDNDGGKLADLLSDSDGRTNIYGVNSDKKVISIIINGTEKGEYDLSLSVENPNSLLISYLTTGNLEETAKDAIKASANCMIVYKASEGLEAGSDDFYVSTKATVKIESIQTVGIIKYVKGTFTGTLANAKGDKIEITDGKFSCPGK